MRRAWRGPQGVAALVVLVVTGLWRGLLLKGSYFNQDDYYLTTRAYHQRYPTWDFLVEPVAGHVQPAQQLAYWLVAHQAPFDWPQVAAAVLVAQLATLVVLWFLLSRLLPDRWVRLPLLAVVAWSPLTLVPTLWWSAAMGLWPPMFFMLLATLFLLRADQHGGRRWTDLALCVGASVLALTWHDRGVLTVAVLAGVAVARSSARGWRRIPEAAHRFCPLWTVLAALTVGYLVFHGAVTTVETQPGTLTSRLEIVRAFVLRNALPGLASGPWQARTNGGAIVPASWVVVVAALLAVLVAVVLVRRGGRGRWAALVMLAAYVAGDLLLLLLGRAGFGEIIGLDPRYTADIVGPAVVFAAVALERAVPGNTIGAGAAEGERNWRWRGWSWRGAATAGAVLGLYLVGAIVTTAHLAPTYSNSDDRQFMTTLRSDLARDPDQVLLDRLAPPEILLPLLGKEALLSSVLAPLPEHPVFDRPSRKLRAITDEGHLVAPRLLPAASAATGPDGACGYAVGSGPTTVPLAGAVPLTGRTLVRLDVFTDGAADYRLQVGTWSASFHVVRGPQEVWVVVPEQAGPYRSIAVSGTGTRTLCIPAVVAGVPAEIP